MVKRLVQSLSRDIHLHPHPPNLNNCEAHWGSRWKGNVSIGTLNMPHNIVEGHLRLQMNVTRIAQPVSLQRKQPLEEVVRTADNQ